VSSTLNFAEGDEIIISSLDHEANIAPWLSLAERQKLVVRWWTPKSSDKKPRLLPEDLMALLSPKTRLVACTHCSNILGTISEIKTIAAAVHTIPGALLAVDGVAYAPHRPIDVKHLEVDFYCFSWYKVYGPHLSMLYASRKAQEQMKAMNHFFNPTESLEHKIGLAGANYEMVQSVPAAVDYFGPKGSGSWDAIVQHEGKLQAKLLEYLNSKPDVFTIYGETSADPNLRVPTISFTAKGWNSQKLVQAVEKESNFGFRWGSFYSNRLTREVLGLEADGVVRISAVHYNTGMFFAPSKLEIRPWMNRH
jgi:selenocysteine lyase/cysteine desulfurase